MEHLARDLALEQGWLERAKGRATQFADLASITGVLDAVHAHWGSTRSEEPTRRKASEWFLDNESLFRRALRQVTGELPVGFQKRLPSLAEGLRIGSHTVQSSWTIPTG